MNYKINHTGANLALNPAAPIVTQRMKLLECFRLK